MQAPVAAQIDSVLFHAMIAISFPDELMARLHDVPEYDLDMLERHLDDQCRIAMIALKNRE